MVVFFLFSFFSLSFSLFRSFFSHFFHPSLPAPFLSLLPPQVGLRLRRCPAQRRQGLPGSSPPARGGLERYR